jgi:hypothetical protein
MRLFVNDMLRGTLVDVRMRFQLKEEVQDVDQKKDLLESAAVENYQAQTNLPRSCLG